MNKQELIDAVASDVGIGESAAAGAVDAVAQRHVQAVAGGDSVELIGFWHVHRPGGLRAGRNPQTGEAVIAAAKTVKFTAGKAFKDAVNR